MISEAWCLPSIMLYVMYVGSASAMTNEDVIFVSVQFKSNQLYFFCSSCQLGALLYPGDNGATCPHVAHLKIKLWTQCSTAVPVQGQNVRIFLFVWSCWYTMVWQDDQNTTIYSFWLPDNPNILLPQHNCFYYCGLWIPDLDLVELESRTRTHSCLGLLMQSNRSKLHFLQEKH